jgi:hypothetical protein
MARSTQPVGEQLDLSSARPADRRARPDEKLAERRPIGQEHAEFDNLRAVVKAKVDADRLI